MVIVITKATDKSTYDEHILVVPRDVLFPHGAWQGVRRGDVNEYIALINNHREFLPRSIMENDPRYKQIIPYLIFKYQNRYFLMQRKAKASETRLQGKFTFGIGGHIRQEDLQGTSTIFDWARREFYEEISYQGSFTITSLGLLNDDSNAVGQVHAGFVMLLEGDSDQIQVKDELESGCLLTLPECHEYSSRLESWSALVLPLLG